MRSEVSLLTPLLPPLSSNEALDRPILALPRSSAESKGWEYLLTLDARGVYDVSIGCCGEDPDNALLFFVGTKLSSMSKGVARLMRERDFAAGVGGAGLAKTGFGLGAEDEADCCPFAALLLRTGVGVVVALEMGFAEGRGASRSSLS